MRNIVVLTGAGLSAESGVPTFRTHGTVAYWEYDEDGVRKRRRVEEICTPQALLRDPALVHGFYDARRDALASVVPNAAHQALARLDASWPGDLLIITQNVDDLHERAGARRLVHMHGELLSALCDRCDARQHWREALPPGLSCPSCGIGHLRPDIVFFGEMPYQMDRISAAISEADLFVSIGTSGAVYPAAGFVEAARAAGATTLELNLEASAGSARFDECRRGPATQLVPAWVAELLDRTGSGGAPPD